MKRMTKMFKYFFMVMALFVFSCTKKSTPEGVLQDFVSYRFKDNQSMENLFEMTASPLQDRLKDLKEDELKNFLDSTNLKKKKLKVLLKNCEGEKCFITYVIGYDQGKTTDNDFGVEVKKIAQVIKSGEEWKIADVNNVKTYIEDKKGLEISDQGPTEKP